jgi:hypothetical protein
MDMDRFSSSSLPELIALYDKVMLFRHSYPVAHQVLSTGVERVKKACLIDALSLISPQEKSS